VSSITLEPLDPKRHDRASFSCGEESLDSYLKTQASQDVKKGLAACFVAATPEGRIAGYYTLSPYGVAVQNLPMDLQRKLPHYPVVPSYLLGRLAVDERDRGTGLGGVLLVDALERAAQAEIPAVAMVVDALNASAASFYAYYGFEQFASAPSRLFMPLATVRKRS